MRLLNFPYHLAGHLLLPGVLFAFLLCLERISIAEDQLSSASVSSGSSSSSASSENTPAERTLGSLRSIQCSRAQQAEVANLSPSFSQLCYKSPSDISINGYLVRNGARFLMWVFNCPKFISDNFDFENRKPKIRYSHEGSGTFELRFFDAESKKQIGETFSQQGSFTATKTLDLPASSYFEVHATGPWYLVVE